MNKKSMAAAVALGLGLSLAAPAMAVTYDFSSLVQANGGGNIGSQFTMDVTDGGSGSVLFKFWNTLGTASSITDIYFDDSVAYSGSGANQTADYTGAFFNSIAVSGDSGSGVAFSDGATPSDMPGGGAISFTSDFSGDSDAPASGNGLDANGEWVSFLGTLQGTNTFEDILTALASGDFRVGLHVQSIGTNGISQTYVNGACVSSCPETGGGEGTVPLPGAAWLFGTALLGFMAKAGRRRGWLFSRRAGFPARLAGQKGRAMNLSRLVKAGLAVGLTCLPALSAASEVTWYHLAVTDTVIQPFSGSFDGGSVLYAFDLSAPEGSMIGVSIQVDMDGDAGELALGFWRDAEGDGVGMFGLEDHEVVSLPDSPPGALFASGLAPGVYFLTVSGPLGSDSDYAGMLTAAVPSEEGGNGSVPLPGASWLFGSVLLGFVSTQWQGRKKIVRLAGNKLLKAMVGWE